jgi:iron complex outermembrane receptor protein
MNDQVNANTNLPLPSRSSTPTKTKLALAVSMLVLLGAGNAAAQQTEEPGNETVDERAQAKAEEADDGYENVLEELVVTAPAYVSTGSRSASKSDVALVDIPQSVTVISRDQIDLLEWNSLQEATRYTAGVVGENFGPDVRYDWLTVRGFQPLQFIDGLQAPIGSVSNVGTDLYGFESVEVLKGPSSVLYGQTPPGGIINMTSRRPQRETAGEFGAQYGSFNYWQVNGDYTGPINDALSFRITGLYRDTDTQTDFVNSKRTYLAPALTIDFNEDASLTLLGYYQKDDIDNWAQGFLPAEGTLLPNPNGMIPVSFSMGEPGINRYWREQYGVGYNFEYDFNGGVKLEQNLKYFSADSEMAGTYGQGFVDNDFDGVPDDYRTVNRADFPFDEEIDSFAVDTRVYFGFDTGAASHNVLAGLDYRKYDALSAFGFASSTWPPGSVPTLDVFNPVYGVPYAPPVANIPYTDQVQKQTGLYVQDQINIGKLILTLSGRQDWVNSDNAGTTVKDDEFTYRVGLNYVLDNGFAPYIQAASSFQPVAGSDFFGNPFIPTTGKLVEGGIKWDGRDLNDDVKVFASAALYTLKQKNVLVNDPDHLFFQVQTGFVDVSGFEFEAVTRIRERVSINFSYTYTDSEVGQEKTALPAVSKHKLSALAVYTFQDGALAGLGAGLGMRYLSSLYGDPANLWEVPGVTLWDALISYDMEHWRFGVTASNLTDKEYVARCSSAADCFYGTVRNIIGSVTYKF